VSGPSIKLAQSWPRGSLQFSNPCPPPSPLSSPPIEYAQVLRMLGDGRLALSCYDGVARTGLIRGTMRRRVWINTGDIVLIGLREFQADKADVIHKYTTEEARNLQAYGELPANARINQTAIDMAMEGGEGEGDVDFEFEDI